MGSFFAVLLFYVGIFKVANTEMIAFPQRRIRRNIRDFTIPKANNEYFPYSAIVFFK